LTYAHPDVVFPVRLPGHARYLSTLGEAVRRVVQEGGDPAEALDEVAAAWQAVTESRGAVQQQSAMRKNLGLE
ncbi:MAG: hypothetical protein KDA60_14090, partial [Planctomycetales bacterium]|nr:hypothetical protein [Planctomycetales bacterium]